MADTYKRDFFRRAVNSPYHSELRREYLLPFLRHLDDKGKLGRVIVNLGSAGTHIVNLATREELVSRNYIPTEGKKVINFDLGFDRPFEKISDEVVNIQGDLDNSIDSFSVRRRLVLAKKFLGQRVKADTIVMADVLNYVDFKKVISNAHRLLNDNGRVVIVNTPNLGVGFFHPNGPRSNQLIVNFLKNAGFEVEHCGSEDGPASEYPNYSFRPPSVGALIVAKKKIS